MRKTISPTPPSFPSLVQQFFTDYLITQRALSACTIASYRDAMMLFLEFSQQYIGKAPTAVQLSDFSSEHIIAFLNYLERERGNSVRSRNLRLAALKAFLKFAGRRDLSSLHFIEQALAVPMKRFEQPMLGFLSRDEMTAVLGQPGADWTSQRDHLLFVMLYNTGARVSEIIGVRVADVVLNGAHCVHLHGKGRKQRAIPLWKSTVQEIRSWLRDNSASRSDAVLLPNRNGTSMTRSNVVQRLEIAVTRAAIVCPDIAKKRISPHTIRHTTAMHLLQSGIAFNVIALWLGHESVNTTHRYVEADMSMKDKSLARLEAPNVKMRRFHPTDELIAFLKCL